MTSYTTGAIAMRELAATAADQAGQHGLAMLIRSLPVPATPTEPHVGMCFSWDDSAGVVVHVGDETVAVRLTSGAMRWPTRRQWDDAVRYGDIRLET